MISRRTLLIGSASSALPILSGCRTTLVSLDYFQRYLIIGFGQPETNPAPIPTIGPNGLITKGHLCAVGESVPVWFRAVQIEEVSKPSPLQAFEADVMLSVVGDKGQATTGAQLVTGHCRTSPDGYNDRPLTFRASQIGVFRIAAVFPDRRTKSRSLSRFIIAD